MLGSRFPANRTSAIPLRNTTTCRGAQDDDAKHDPSPGISNALNSTFNYKRFEGGHQHVHGPDSGTCHAWRSTCVKREAYAAAYLRAAHAYMLISMPTGTSTIFGVFQAILALLVETGRTPPSQYKLARTKSSPVKSLVANPSPFYVAVQDEFTVLCGLPSKQCRINRFRVARTATGCCCRSTLAWRVPDKELVRATGSAREPSTKVVFDPCRDISSTPVSATN